jgi:hypothetical protein
MLHRLSCLLLIAAAGFAADAAPALLDLPPVPVLVLPAATPRASGGPIGHADDAIGAFRQAMRQKQCGLAEATLAMTSTDTPGYRDLVKMLSALRTDQNAAHEALSAAFKARRCGDLAIAANHAAQYPDLAAPVMQAQAWLGVVEGIYDRAIGRVTAAVTSKDAATAQRELASIPTDTALLPPAIAVKRAAAEQAVAALAAHP